MTIETTVEFSASATTAGFRYVRDSTVAIVSATGKRYAPSTPAMSVLEACAKRLASLVVRVMSGPPSGALMLFVATPFWDQHNVVSRRRGVWGRDDLRWLPPAASRSNDVEITRESASRFAGLAKIEAASFLDACEFLRTHESSFLFISSRADIDDERVRAMVLEVFPTGAPNVDWGSVVAQVGNEAAACVRVSGSFDDPEISIDVFMSADVFVTLRIDRWAQEDASENAKLR